MIAKHVEKLLLAGVVPGSPTPTAVARTPEGTS